MITKVFYKNHETDYRLRSERISAQDAPIYESHNNYTSFTPSLRLICLCGSAVHNREASRRTSEAR